VTLSVRFVHSAVTALTLLLCARVAAAQTPAAQTPAADDPQHPKVELLPRTAFHMSAEHLSGDDVMFVWDANFGGDLDVIDYGTGRATFVANYQAILGDEFRHFDPNQGNYILSGSASLRTSDVEVAGVFYHQSRHLADRPNRVAVAWNMMGVRLQKAVTEGRAHVDARIDVRGVIARAFVDYTWEIETAVRSDVQIRPAIGLLFGGAFRRLGVNDTQNRGDQTGFRGEAGLRVEGRAGAMEFFLAAERRVDPFPLEFGTARFVTVGFRLLSR
jgi:hypothetical protein